MKLFATITVLCLAATLPAANGDLKDIKIKDILGGIFQNVRHIFLTSIHNTTYELNAIDALDEFTDKLSVADLVSVPADGGAAVHKVLLDSVSDAFKNTDIQSDIVGAFKYIIDNTSILDLLSFFTGFNTEHLFDVWNKGLQLNIKNPAALKELVKELDSLLPNLSLTNKGAKERLEEANEQPN